MGLIPAFLEITEALKDSIPDMIPFEVGTSFYEWKGREKGKGGGVGEGEGLGLKNGLKGPESEPHLYFC